MTASRNGEQGSAHGRRPIDFLIDVAGRVFLKRRRRRPHLDGGATVAHRVDKDRCSASRGGRFATRAQIWMMVMIAVLVATASCVDSTIAGYGIDRGT
jgi:hypothetical protein